jgi:hypothetical protein
MLALGLVVTVQGVGPALADVTSDRAAAIVHFPLVAVDTELLSDEAIYSETLIQLSNTSNDPIDVTCFYENANAHCTNTGEVCDLGESGQCCNGELGCGLCLPGWNETDFHIRLTPRQPLGWLASKGLTKFPIDGLVRVGSDGSSNAGSRIPPVAEDPFRGMLKCIAVDETGAPVDRNVLKGEATLTLFDDSAFKEGDFQLLGSAKYNAVGIQAIEGQVNDDRTLVLGGDGAEYNGCPNVLILNHFFADGDNPVFDSSSNELDTSIVLVPCTQNLLRQEPGSAVVQFLVFNEFEQRFSTSRPIECQFLSVLEEIDTTQDERSIFNVAVAGTLGGQTRMTPIGSGLIGMAFEEYDLDRESSAFNIHFQGDRADSDFVILP